MAKCSLSCLLLVVVVCSGQNDLQSRVERLIGDVNTLKDQRDEDRLLVQQLIDQCRQDRSSDAGLQHVNVVASTVDPSAASTIQQHRLSQCETSLNILRDQMRNVKAEMESLKERVHESGRWAHDGETASENAAKTLHWLLSTVNELKTDLVELNQQMNLSQALQQSDDVLKHLHLFKGEVNQLRQQITEESVAQQRMAAEMAQIRADVDESVGRNRICQQKCNDVTSEVQVLAANNSRSESSHWLNVSNKLREITQVLASISARQDRLHSEMIHLKRNNAAVVSTTSSRAASDPVRQMKQQINELRDRFTEVEWKIESINQSNASLNTAVLDKLEKSNRRIQQQLDFIEEGNQLEIKRIGVMIEQLHYNVTDMQSNQNHALQQIRVVNETLTKMTSSGEQRNHQQTEFQSPDELLSGEEEMPDH